MASYEHDVDVQSLLYEAGRTTDYSTTEYLAAQDELTVKQLRWVREVARTILAESPNVD